MVSSGACFVYRLIKMQSTYPFKIFQLLHDPAAHVHIQRDPPCVMDPWSLDIVRAHASAGLSSAACLADVEHAAAVARQDTVLVEKGHAHVRRDLFIGSAHTHTVAVDKASAKYCMRQLRRNQGTRLRRECPDAVGPLPANAAALESGTQRQRRGGGGLWRAFVREQSYGQQGSPDFADLGRRYRLLSASEKSTLAPRAANATQAHRDGGAPSFGHKSRAVKQAERRRVFARDVELEQQAEAAKRRCTLTLCDEAHGRPPCAVMPRAGVDSDVLAWSQLSKLKYALRVQQAAALRRREAIRQRMVAASIADGSPGQLALAQASRASDAVRARVGELEVRVGTRSSLVSLRWNPVNVLRRAEEAVSLDRASQAWKKLATAMRSMWSMTHTTKQHNDNAATNARGPATSVCYSFGRCLCNIEGRKTWLMHKSMARALRKRCPPKSSTRALLANSHMFLCIFGERRTAASANSREDQRSLAALWYHLGAHNLVEFSWTGQRMLPVQPHGTVDSIPHIIRLTAARSYATSHDVAAELDKALHWSILVYKPVWGYQFLGEITPYELDVTRAVDEAQILWPVARRRHGPPRGLGAWAACESSPSSSNNDGSSSASSPSHRTDGSGSGGDGSDADRVRMCREDSGDHAAEVRPARGGVGSSSNSGSSYSSSSSSSSSASVMEMLRDVETASSSDAEDSSPSSSGGAPPAPAVVPIRVGRGRPAAAIVSVPNGRIAYYENTVDFYGYCLDPLCHGCRLSRRGNARASNPAQGRPLGLLMAWIQASGTQAHIDKGPWPDYEARCRARAALAAIDGANALFAFERARRPDEGDEPLVAP